MPSTWGDEAYGDGMADVYDDWYHDVTDVGATVAVVQELAQLDRLLAPVAERFGAEKRRQVETFLRRQAQLGLKHKVEGLTPDPQLRAAMTAEVAALRQEVDDLRRTIGVYCMSYVRSILPPTGEPLWVRLNTALAEPPPPTRRSLWQTIDQKMNQS